MSHIGPLLCPLLVGRDDLLQLAERRIAEAASGRGHLLMLAGEAGIGKTRLLATALRRARASGFRIAKGDLSPHDRQVPLASVLDLARTMRDDAAFGPLGRELLEVEGGQGGDSLGSRRLLVRDIADRIVATVDTPTVLAFEDLQWADELSLEVVGELARLAPERPLLLLAAYRLEELPAGSLHREWRSRLLSQRLAEEARLDRLTYDQTALVTTLILATGLPAPREVVNAVFERTNGIPLHIEELLAALDDEARTDGRAIRDAVVPDTIEDAVLARAKRLSDDARAVARAGAVIGRCFIPEVLAGVMDRPLADLDAPLAELVAASVLHPFEFLDRGYFDFRHQLLRDALYASVPPRELRKLHARAGEFGGLIEGASEIHASVHFERAGLRAQAYRTALAAARAASAISSRQEAFELYGRAAANVPDGLSAAELAELYDGYSEAAFAIDNMVVAEETASLARRFYLEADRPVEAANQLMNLSGMARRDVRPPEERRRLLDQAEAELMALADSAERSLALSDLRQVQSFAEIDALRLDRASALVEDAERFARAAGDVHEGDFDFYRAEVDILAGRVDAGMARLLGVAREARDENRESTGVTAFRVAAALAVRVMDYDAAEIGLREGMRYADAIEQSYCRRVMAATLAHVAWADGRWDEAIATAAIELVERGTRRGTLGSQNALGFVAFGRGEVAHARTMLEESLEIARASVEVDLVLPPLWGLAETALIAGEPDVAVGQCEEALALAESTGERALLIPFVVTGVRALLAVRRPDDAERWLSRSAALLAEWRPRAAAAIAHGEGLVRLAAGSTTGARESLEAAVAGWGQLGRIWEATWARLDLARCLARAGRVAAALDLLTDARATASSLGSTPLLARADELTHTVRGRSMDDEPWRPLTAREFEVGRLIAAGLTNGEIATSLSIAPKTASAHVEHILAKLGLARRAEVAAWVARVAPREVPTGVAGSMRRNGSEPAAAVGEAVGSRR
jgi:DNA-binding CsgD family transcriptional regulator/tetratricopeptide (TPR) repeat protein